MEEFFPGSVHLGLVKDPAPYFPHDDDPFSNDVAQIANILGKTTKKVAFEMEAYGARNQACHDGVSSLIHKWHWWPNSYQATSWI